MNAKDYIMKALSYWFENQLGEGCSLEETILVIKVCTLLDVAQLFLGYDDDKMASKDDKIKDACFEFLDKLREIDRR